MEKFERDGMVAVLISPGFGAGWSTWAKPLPIIKPSINWDHVSKEFNWLAVDSDGETYLYTCEPTLVEERCWIYKKGAAMPAKYFFSYSRGNTPWQDSLVQRPVKEGDVM